MKKEKRPTRGRPPAVDPLKTVHFSAPLSQIEAIGGSDKAKQFLISAWNLFLKTNYNNGKSKTTTRQAEKGE